MDIKILRENNFMDRKDYERYIEYFIQLGWHKVFARLTNYPETSYTVLEKED